MHPSLVLQLWPSCVAQHPWGWSQLRSASGASGCRGEQTCEARSVVESSFLGATCLTLTAPTLVPSQRTANAYAKHEPGLHTAPALRERLTLHIQLHSSCTRSFFGFVKIQHEGLVVSLTQVSLKTLVIVSDGIGVCICHIFTVLSEWNKNWACFFICHCSIVMQAKALVKHVAMMTGEGSDSPLLLAEKHLPCKTKIKWNQFQVN